MLNGTVIFDEKKYDFSYSYELLLCLFKELESQRTGLKTKHVKKTELVSLELDTFTYLSTDLFSTKLTEELVYMALVNSKYAKAFAAEHGYEPMKAARILQRTVREIFRKFSRTVMRAKWQVTEELKK
tara:strand:+ start:3428 stop:3811 length:384 start_codon:yes stop_codon:yes gene_type:complete